VGAATPLTPLIGSFPVTVEGRHALSARLSNPGDTPARLYLKVDYLGPAVPTAF
jgi:alpha-amylase